MRKVTQDTVRIVRLWMKNGKTIDLLENHMSDDHFDLSDSELALLFCEAFATSVTVEYKRQTTVQY